MAVDSFFANSRKRKRPSKPTNTVQRNGGGKGRAPAAAKAQPKKKQVDSDIEGDEEEDDHFNADQSTASEAESSEEEIEETAAEKRVRLAKAYLGTIEESLDGKQDFSVWHIVCSSDIDMRNVLDDINGFDAADLDRDLIAERLKKDDVCFHIFFWQ